MEENDFYEQIVRAHRTGIDPETNWLKTERDMINNAIEYLKFKALEAATLGNSTFAWVIQRDGGDQFYPAKNQSRDKCVNERALFLFLHQSAQNFEAVEKLMKESLWVRGKVIFHLRSGFLHSGSYIADLDWVTPEERTDENL